MEIPGILVQAILTILVSLVYFTVKEAKRRIDVINRRQKMVMVILLELARHDPEIERKLEQDVKALIRMNGD